MPASTGHAKSASLYLERGAANQGLRYFVPGFRDQPLKSGARDTHLSGGINLMPPVQISQA